MVPRPAAFALALAAALPAAAADLPSEQALKTAVAAAEPAVACVVVSRSELYPRDPAASPADPPGTLGGFDPKDLAADPARRDLARRLDLSDPRNTPDHGYAGGVVIDPAGLVLTPYHVVDGATKVYVRLPGGKGSYADVHAADARSDLAVLRLRTPPPDLTPVRFADPDGPPPAKGSWVVALSQPFAAGFADGRVTAGLGVLSGVDQRLPPSDKEDQRSRTVYQYGTLLTYDAKLPGGLSGAALLTPAGELIGLTTTVAAVAGGDAAPAYALPMDANARRVVEVLRRGREVEYGFLGVTFDQRFGGGGVRIGDVTPQTPAAAAGLRSDDVITRVNGRPVGGPSDLLLHVGSALAGSTVRMQVANRVGRVREVEATLTKFLHAQPVVASVKPEPVFGLRVDYGSILLQQLLGGGPAAAVGLPPGVVVREAADGSPAAKALKPVTDGGGRWLITAVDGRPVATPADFYNQARGRPAVKLTLLDVTDPAGRTRDVTIP